MKARWPLRRPPARPGMRSGLPTPRLWWIPMPISGIVQVSGYLNMRKKPESGSQVVGKLMDGSACEVQETLDGWYHVNSGGIDGYVSSEYVITGDAAKEKALSMVTDRAVVTTDNLNIREQPSTDSNIVGQCLEGERYEILGEEDGWYQIDGGYISEFAEKRFP